MSYNVAEYVIGWLFMSYEMIKKVRIYLKLFRVIHQRCTHTTHTNTYIHTYTHIHTHTYIHTHTDRPTIAICHNATLCISPKTYYEPVTLINVFVSR